VQNHSHHRLKVGGVVCVFERASNLGYNAEMSEAREYADEVTPRGVRAAFGISFFLPALYLLLVMSPFDEGKRTDPTLRYALQCGIVATWVVSILIPIVVVVASKQKFHAKIGQVLFTIVVWSVIQFCVFLVLGVASLMLFGLPEIQ
jgi:hypothetical protein